MRRLTLILFLSVFVGIGSLWAQTRTITGTVTDSEDGQPIPGVSIVVKGTTKGTITDINGKYSLSVPQDASTLIFSFVGMESQEVEIQGRTVINISMKQENLGLDEVIVTGYVKKSKNSLTGSTVQVSGDELKNVPVTSVDQTLQGKVAGLVISTSSGTPGAVQDIRIRGAGSLSANNDPLIVIDGVPVINSNESGSSSRSSLSALAAINSNDIESVTVLKDASATSAYGARGSNGVIVITTKKGKKQKTSYNVSAYYGFQNKAVKGWDVLTGTQREELFLEAIYNQYGEDYGFDEEGAYDWAKSVGLTGALDEWIDGGRKEGNWEDAMMRDNSPVYNFNVSASGGDDVSSFYASAGYNKTNSIVVGSDFQRINGSLNYNRKLGKRVSFSTSNSVSNTIQNGAILEQSAYFANPILAKYFQSPWNQPYDENGEANTDVGMLYNWLYLKDHDITTNDMIRAISNSNLEWEIIKNLKFKTLISLDYILTNYKNYSNREYGDASQENGSSEASTSRNFNYVFQNSFSYRFTKNDHSVYALALMEYQKNKYNYLYGYGEKFVTDGLTNIESAGANKDASSSFTDWMNASYLFLMNYDYKSKYFIDLTYRNEGSSRFAPGKRFGSFWSVGAAWNLKKENFLFDADWLSNLKLRASYGISGNSAIGLNRYQALLAFNSDYAGSGAIYPSEFGNDDLTWEKNKNYDLGIDFAVLSNRISGSFAYFNKTTFDLLQNVPLSRTTGHNSIMMNVGEVVNKGIEVIADFGIIRTDKFNLDVSLNYATLNNEVTKLAKDASGEYINIETSTRKVEVGHPIYEWHMKKWAGVNPDNGAPQWYINGKDGDVTENYFEAELEFQGKSAIPTHTGGASLHVDFIGIYLDANMYYAGGHKIYESWARYTHHAGFYPVGLFNGVSELMDRWQKPGDVTDVPIQMYDGNGQYASNNSTRFLYDGDYIRLKDLVLGYNLPQSIVSKIKFTGISIYVRGTNILTWVKDDRLKYDPEVRADGFTNLTNPPVKSFSFGLNLNF